MAGAVTFLQNTDDTTDLTTYTFAAQNLGTASADREIIVAVHARDTGAAAKTLVSATIAGIAATIRAQVQATGSNSSISALIQAAVPTGTSGDIVLTFSEQVVNCHIGVFAATAIAAAPHNTASSTASDPSVNIDIPSGGIAVGCGTCSGTTTAAWTGLTERYDTQPGATYTGGSAAFVSQQLGLAILINFAASTEPAGVFASWGPLASGSGLLTKLQAHGLFTGDPFI